VREYLSLHPGAVTESVSVEAVAPVIKTDDATISATVGDLAPGADKLQKLSAMTRQPGRHVVEVEITSTNGDKTVARTRRRITPDACYLTTCCCA
jgi:hypothetical protein